MLYHFFKVLFIYFRSLLMATFSFKKDKPLYLSGINLTRRSFRLNQADYSDRLIVVKGFFRFVRQAFSSSGYSLDNKTGDEFIYDLRTDEIRKKYIQHFTGKWIEASIGKEFLISAIGILNKLIITFVYLIIVIPYFLFTLFSAKKAVLSLAFREIAENSVLLYLVGKNKLNKCYFFSIYEKDANLAAYLLMRSGINVIKIPSEVPFYFFNTTIVCNKLIFCNAYQSEEREFYKDTILCNDTEMWGPERVTDFYDIYKNGNYEIKRNAIAFYSTASWVREKEGHLDQGTGMVRNEKLLLNYLKKYLTKRKELKLIIYAHPKEKTDKYLNETKEYYHSVLDTIPFEFADFSLLSAASFYNAELAVAFNSTLVYERLYFGFKTLMLPLDHPGFPLEGSSLSNICAYSEEELFLKLDKSFSQNEDEFFESNGLQKYKFKR